MGSHSKKAGATIRRRSALKLAAAGAVWPFTLKSKEKAKAPLKVAFIGCGVQGNGLLDSLRLVSSDDFVIVAVCDPLPYRRAYFAKYTERVLGSGSCAQYVLAEQLFSEHSLDVVFVATPDYSHHQYAIMAMEHGAHVYCECPISNTIEGGREIIRAQRRTGKLLQIGNQRRSNPCYRYARDRIMHGPEKLLGDGINSNSAWLTDSRSSGAIFGWNFTQLAPSDDTLTKLGYPAGPEGVCVFKNWRRFRKYGLGLFGEQATHQVDVLNWFYRTAPQCVSAVGLLQKSFLESYQEAVESARQIVKSRKGRWLNDELQVLLDGAIDLKLQADDPDTVSCQFVYEPEESVPVVANYQMRSNAHDRIPYRQRLYQEFIGQKGTLHMSQFTYHIALFPDWTSEEEWIELERKNNPVIRRSDKKYERDLLRFIEIQKSWELPVVMNEQPHVLHVRNFLETVRANGEQSDLNSSPEEAFETLVTILKVYDAIELRRTVDFEKKDFEI